MKLAGKDLCTGCGGCASICAHQAIQMKPDRDGFYIPYIDDDRCIKCGACVKICPAFCEHKNAFETSTCFAIWDNDQNKRREASSGGAFGQFAEWVINNGGVVFGAAFSENYRYLSCKCSDEVPLSKLKKSKYFESNMNVAIKNIKEELEKDRWVLFCGTPCQAMGVRAAISNKFEKLIIIDFLCHGVPSQMAYNKYIDDIEKKYDSVVKKVSFRSKKYGWKTYCMYIEFETGKRYLKLSMFDPFYKLFFSNLSLRGSCYNCTRVRQSEADITIGDFWGIINLKNFKDTDEGVSLVFIHNEKGKQLLNLIKDDITSTKLEAESYSYAMQVKKKSKCKNIIFTDFNFFNNSILPKNSVKDYLKVPFLMTKLGRKIIYRK